MASPQDIGNALGSYFNGPIVAEIIRWTGYILISAIILTVLVIVYYLVQYKYKVTYPVLHYNNDKTKAKIVGFRKDRARDVKKSGIRKQQLLFKRKLIEPFREEDVLYPGNKVNILKINDDGTYIPLPTVKFSEQVGAFETLTPEERYWAILQLQENAKTFQSEDASKKAMLITMLTVIFCLIAAGVTVYLCLKAPNRVVDAFDAFGSQFMNVAQSMGGTPPN